MWICIHEKHNVSDDCMYMWQNRLLMIFDHTDLSCQLFHMPSLTNIPAAWISDDSCNFIKMANFEVDIDKIVQIFRDVIKRKITYNETNPHSEYFKRFGDTILFKTHGLASLSELINKKVCELFYFEFFFNEFDWCSTSDENSTENGSSTKSKQLEFGTRWWFVMTTICSFDI